MKRKVYFYVREQPVIYQDAIVVLADGLRQVGVDVFGSANYWRRSTSDEDWLVPAHPHVRPEHCDVVVVSDTWCKAIDASFRVHEAPLPAGLFAPARTYRTAYLDLADGYPTTSWQPAFAAFDVVLRAKFNRRCAHPPRHQPWALGVSTRMLDATRHAPPWETRRPNVLINFGASHPYAHPARTRLTKPFIDAVRPFMDVDERRDDLSRPPETPYDRLMWEQTQHRHHPDYFRRLNETRAIAAFCGDLIPPSPIRPRYLAGGRRARLQRRCYELLSRLDPRPLRLIQWDSWRFWEGLAAGCLVFNLDLSHYGVELPVMPRHLEHYVAVRPETLTTVISELRGNPAQLARIAEQGRAWALEHYSPKALATRFLHLTLGSAGR